LHIDIVVDDANDPHALDGVETATGKAAAKVVDYAITPGQDSDFDVVNSSIPADLCVVRTSDGLQVTGPCRIVGYVVSVATATAAIHVEDGLTDAGTLRFVIPASTAVGVYHFGGIGISCATGAYLDFQASATGSVALLVQLGAGSTLAT
jgi:hypothetical protein